MKITLAILLLFCSFFADANQIIKVTPQGPRFVVSLKANPTTGYQWVLLSYDTKRFRLLDSKYQAPNRRLMGAGGQMNFRFALLKDRHYPHSTQMIFRYARSWEPQTEPMQKMQVQFAP
jgi:inhibitor of cysteine peptidase